MTQQRPEPELRLNFLCRKSSGVDGRALDDVHSVRLQQDAEFELNGRSIRCTEVTFSCGVGGRASACSAWPDLI